MKGASLGETGPSATGAKQRRNPPAQGRRGMLACVALKTACRDELRPGCTVGLGGSFRDRRMPCGARLPPPRQMQSQAKVVSLLVRASRFNGRATTSSLAGMGGDWPCGRLLARKAGNR